MGLRPAMAAMILLLGTGVDWELRSPETGRFWTRLAAVARRPNATGLNLALPGTSSASTPQTAGVLSSNVDGVVYVDGVKYPKTEVGIQAALTAAGAGTVLLAPGIYKLAAAIRMTTSGQQLVCTGSGSTTLSYTGTANIPAIIDVGTAADGTNNLYNISVNGCTVSGNPHVTDAIRSRGVHHSDFSNNSLINVTEAGIHTFFAVGLKLDSLRTSINEGHFALRPASCIILDGPDASHETTVSTIKLPLCEGVSGDGIKFGYALEDKVISGTSEGNSTGINITSEASAISVEGTDMEANLTDVIVAGTQTVLSGIWATTLVHVLGTSQGARLSGGVYNSITIDANALNTHLETLSYNSSRAGRISDAGTATSKFAVYNSNGSAYDENLFATGTALPLSTKSSRYTLSVHDSWVNVTGNTTITVPHALKGQRWVVFNSGAGAVTIHPDTGQINGGSSIMLAANNGKEVTCDGTNCWAR